MALAGSGSGSEALALAVAACVQVHIVREWTEHTPIPRVAAHVPWTMKFYAGTNYTDYSPKVTMLYVSVAMYYAQEGMCHSFPEGAIEGCEDFRDSQEQVWKYALDWDDWPLVNGGKKGEVRQGATVVYDRHIEEIRCMYMKLVTGASQLPQPQKVKRLKECILPLTWS